MNTKSAKIDATKKKKKRKNNKKIENDFLFETITVIDIDEFKKFQKFYLNKFKNSLLPKIVMLFLAILAVVLNLLKGNIDIVIMVIIFLIVYPIILNLTLNMQIKKMYKTNKRINMLEEQITFYEDFFISNSIHNYCKVQYNDIYKVCETKSNFYIFISDNQSFIIIKNNLNDVGSFREFISSKSLYRKYR